MNIIRIAVKSNSGYTVLEEAYHDKVAVMPNAIEYEYNPECESQENVYRSWHYRTNSPIFAELFKRIVAEVEEILTRENEEVFDGIGEIEFAVTYEDHTKRRRIFSAPGDAFRDCFILIREMVPKCEYMPAALLLDDDIMCDFEENED